MVSIHSSPIGPLGTEDTGGMSVYIRELSRELGHNGHQVDIFTRRTDPDQPAVMLLADNVRLIHLDIATAIKGPKLALYPHLPEYFKALEIFRRHEAIHYDVIHSHYWLSTRLGAWAQKYWQRPHLTMFHTVGAVKNGVGAGEKEPQLRLDHEKKLARFCHRIVAATEKEKQNLIKHLAIAAPKITVVPCGVNLDVFKPLPRAASRRKLGLPVNEALLLYVGRFAPVKGIERLLGALALLKGHRRVRLVLVGGDGEHSPAVTRLIELIRRLDVTRQVTFADRVEQTELSLFYSAADALVMPSYYESFGLVGLEALACGTPVVATGSGAMTNIIQTEHAGRIVTEPGPEALAEGIEMLLTQVTQRPRTPDPVRAVAAQFSWAQVAQAITEEYRLLVRQVTSCDANRSVPPN